MHVVPARGVRDNMDKHKKILYISNIEVPYRVSFFNDFAKYCDLTVLYERKKSDNRDENWAKSEKRNYKTKFLSGINIKNESTFSLGIIKEIFGKYDKVIIGCYNSPSQMLAILLMKIFRRKYILNIDGEAFVGNKGVKNFLKKFFLSGAEKYVVAGEKAVLSLRSIIPDKIMIPYYFSSMSEEKLRVNAEAEVSRTGKVLVVGQYLDVKGLDVVLAAARKDDTIFYRIVGMGNRTQEFIDKYGADKVENVEIIPFLQKNDLEKEYTSCSLFVLPSRQECWGLVINEAASFGTPIVSTWGSGAAVEFLADEYSNYLAEPGDSDDLYKKIKTALEEKNIQKYSEYLITKSKGYSIERGVEAHCEACDIYNKGDL